MSEPTVTVPADVWAQIVATLNRLDDNQSCPQYAHDAAAVARTVTT